MLKHSFCVVQWHETRGREDLMLTLRIVTVTTVLLLLMLSTSVPDCPFIHSSTLITSVAATRVRAKKD